MEYKKKLTTNISTILTRLLWNGYCSKTKWEIVVGFANVSYKMLGNRKHYCKNVRRKCEKLTSTLILYLSKISQCHYPHKI
jgi:hypothetical protein